MRLGGYTEAECALVRKVRLDKRKFAFVHLDAEKIPRSMITLKEMSCIANFDFRQQNQIVSTDLSKQAVLTAGTIGMGI